MITFQIYLIETKRGLANQPEDSDIQDQHSRDYDCMVGVSSPEALKDICKSYKHA